LWAGGRDRGDRVVLTVKRRRPGAGGAGADTGAVHRRDEWEVDLPKGAAGDRPDGWPASEARDQVLAVAGKAALRPLVEIRQDRVLRRLTRRGDQVGELWLDTVTFVADGDAQQPPRYEVEAELKGAGAEPDLAAIAAALQRDFELAPQPLSKFERALAALDGGAGEPLLSGDEERLLARLARRTDAVGRRARVLLALHGGALQREAATRAGMAPRTVRYWLNRFRSERLAIFPRRLIAAAPRRRAAAPAPVATPAAAQRAAQPSRAAHKQTKAPATKDAAPTAPAKAAPKAATEPAAKAPAAVAPVRRAAPAPAARAATPKRRIRPGIRASDTMAEAAFKTLRFHLDRMLAHEAGTRDGGDPEDLHDMRVATRRMRAALRVFGPYLDARTMHPVNRGLRNTGRVLGAVRDLDVFHEKTLKYLETLPEQRRDELEPLLRVWRERRDEARADLLAYLDGARYPAFVESFGALLDDPARAALPYVTADQEALPHRVALVLPSTLYDRVAAVWAFDDVVGGHDTPLPRFHRLRIAGKAMRYTFEFFEEVLGPGAAPLIQTTKDMQDHLGDLQDAVVTCTILRNFLTWGTWDQPSGGGRRRIMPMIVAPGVAAYLAARQAELNELVDTFPAMWTKVRGEAFGHGLAAVIGDLSS
jgi:CHAD domain-containing protein